MTNAHRRLHRLATELGTTLKGMTAEEKEEFVNGKSKNSNLKIVDRQHGEESRRDKEEEILTPKEEKARLREVRQYLEEIKNGLEGVPFDAVAEEPGDSIRNIQYCGDIEISVSRLAERLHPFLKKLARTLRRKFARRSGRRIRLADSGSYRHQFCPRHPFPRYG